MKIKIRINKNNAMIFLAACLAMIAIIAVSGTYMNPVTHVGHDLDELGPGPLAINLEIDGNLIVNDIKMENLADTNLSNNLANILCLANWSYCLDVMLIDGDHSSLECYQKGGTLVQDPEDGPDDYFCKMPGGCPSGWSQYKSWSETHGKSCCGNNAACSSACASPNGHSWANIAREKDRYRSGANPFGAWCTWRDCWAGLDYSGCK